SDARVFVERAHADRRDLARFRVDAPERRAACGAERLREAGRRLVGADEILARSDVQRAGDDPGLRRRRGAGALLAAGAVAVARGGGRLGALEAHLSTEAAARQRVRHGRESTASQSAGSIVARPAGPRSSVARRSAWMTLVPAARAPSSFSAVAAAARC